MNNLSQLIHMLRFANNPQGLLINMLQQQMPNNPMASNLIQMIQNGDKNGVINMAKNLCAEKGIDPDQAYDDIKNIYK